MNIKSGFVELTKILLQSHCAVSVHPRITAPLIVACSSVSWRLIKAWEELLAWYMGNIAMNFKWDFSQLNAA